MKISNSQSLFIRLCLQQLNQGALMWCNMKTDDYLVSINKLELTYGLKCTRYFTYWNIHLISVYFIFRIIVDIKDILFGKRDFTETKNNGQFLCKFHYILLSSQIQVMIGYWGIARGDFLEGHFKGATTLAIFFIDMRHSVHILFLIIECFFIREKLESKKDKWMPVYFCLIYQAYNFYLKFVCGIMVYHKDDWVTQSKRIQLVMMLLLSYICAIVGMSVKSFITPVRYEETKISKKDK